MPTKNKQYKYTPRKANNHSDISIYFVSWCFVCNYCWVIT